MRVGVVTVLLLGVTACAEILDLGALKDRSDASASDAADEGEAGSPSCTPTIGATATVVTPGGVGTGIAVDDTNVYWTDSASNRVLYCTKSNCGTPQVVAASQTTPSSIAVAGGMVYWTNLGNGDNTGSVAACSTSSLPNCQYKSLSGENHPIAIAVGANQVVWASEGSAADASIGSQNDGTIRTAALDLTGAKTLAGQQGDPNGVALDGKGEVFWVASNYGTVMKCALGSCNPQTVWNQQDFTLAVASDGTNVYWLTLSGVYACDPNKCTVPQVIAAAQDAPAAVAVDCSGVYFTTSTKLATCPQTGCTTPASPQIIDGAENSPFAIALDSTSIYWIDYGDGIVRTASKQ